MLIALQAIPINTSAISSLHDFLVLLFLDGDDRFDRCDVLSFDDGGSGRSVSRGGSLGLGDGFLNLLSDGRDFFFRNSSLCNDSSVEGERE